jgi:integrase
MDLRNLRALDVRQYADSRFATGRSVHTVKGEVSILRRVLNSLVENGALERNPVPRIMTSVAESARAHPDPRRAESRDAWTPEEAWCLLDFAKRHEPKWYPILMFYFQTGARLGEGLALRWDSVDLFGRNIHIRRAVAAGEEGEPKWGKQRHVPISDELLEVLKVLARRRRISEPWKSPELVFPSPRGKQILKRVLQRAWERIRSRAHAGHGVRPLPLHSFRHTWVTMMLRDGQDPQWVAATVGDSLEVIYKHYSHVLPSRHRDLSALRRSPVSPEASEPQPLRAV